MHTQLLKRAAPILLLTVVLLTLLVSNAAHAQTGGDFTLTWWTVDGGGGTATGNGFTLMGTIGQPEPGPALQGSGYTLTSGFWPGGAAATGGFEIFLPMTIK